MNGLAMTCNNSFKGSNKYFIHSLFRVKNSSSVECFSCLSDNSDVPRLELDRKE